MITSDRRFVPHAVFSMPQVASVGLTEAQAEEQGIDYVVSRQDYGETAFGWAMEDTDHFVKIIADAKSKIILGAHVIGPQASSLIQPLIQAMSFEQPAPRSGPRPVLDPSGDDRGARERPARPRRLSPRAPGRSPSVVNPASERKSDGIVGVHARGRLRLSGSHSARFGCAQRGSVSRLMVLATRSARVSGFFPSSIHRAYSLRWVKGSCSYAALAAGLSASAWVSSGGSTTTRS